MKTMKTKTEKLVVRLTEDEKLAFQAVAEANNTSMSQLLRDTALESLKYTTK